MKESTLQMQCVAYLTFIGQKHDDFVFFSIPNEGIMMVLRAFKIPNKIIAGIINFFKKMGMLPGVPDFCILYRKNVFFIEFKAQGREPSKTQKRVHEKFLKASFSVYIYDNFDAFKNFVDAKIKTLKDC